MDHGGEAGSPTELGMAGAVQGNVANIGSGAFDGQLGAAAAAPFNFSSFDISGAPNNSTGFARHLRAVAGRDEAPVAAGFHLHHQPGQGVAYPSIGEFWRQMGPLDALLVGPHLPDVVVPVHDNYGYSALQPRPGAGRGVVLADLVPGGGGGAVYNGDYALQPRPDAGHGDVLVDLLPDGADVVYSSYMWNPSLAAGHGEVFVGLAPHGAGHGGAFLGQLRGCGVVAYDDYVYSALQLRTGAGRGEVLVDQLPDGVGHGGVFVGLLPSGSYYPWQWQPFPGVGSGEVFIGPLPDGVGAVFVNTISFAQQTLPGTGRADGITGALRGRDLVEAYDGSGALADDLGAVYGNRGMVAEHLRRLLPFAGIGASSVAINGLAAGPGSPAVAFHLFVLLLGGMFLVILHVLRV